MFEVGVKLFRLNPLAKLPAYATAGSVGLDLQAMITVDLEPGMPIKIPCGIALQIPDWYEGQIRPRSSLSAVGINCAFGTIDSDYRGELAAVLTATAHAVLGVRRIELGSRIAQLVIVPVSRAVLVEVDSLDALGTTTRGAGGFGSSGR
jgi:dUTP pyrophosphatase